MEYKLLPGMYKIEVQDRSVKQRPVISIENVEVKPGQTTERIATFDRGGILSIMAIKDNVPIQAQVWVTQQQDNTSMGERVTGKDGSPVKYKLLPGMYKIEVQDRSVKQRPVVSIENVGVKPGQTTERIATFDVVPSPPAQPQTVPKDLPMTGDTARNSISIPQTPEQGKALKAPAEQADDHPFMNGEVPLYNGARIVKAKRYGGTVMAELEAAATPAEVVEFYKQAMSAKGWETGMVMVQGNQGVIMLKKSGSQLVIRADAQGTSSTIVMTLISQ